MAIAGLMVCEAPAKGVLILQRILYRINDATFIAERDELTVIGQWGNSSLLNLYSERSPCQAASISATAKRHGAAGQKRDNQTTQAWEHRGAGSCWQKSARVLKLASCRISDI